MEFSIYENNHKKRMEMSSVITFGRVVSVDIPARMVSVRTFLGSGMTDDLYIKRCQWISFDAHHEGDESMTIPRKNSLGLVFIVNGEPFFLGGIRALSADAKATTGKEVEQKLLEGDKIIGTIAGNRIIVKANGVIDLITDETLRRTMYPKTKLISDICSNYTMVTDGGRIKWENLGAPVNLTKYSAEYANGVQRLSLVYDQIGYVSSGIVFQRDVGPGIPTLPGVKVPVFQETIGVDGTYKRGIGPLAKVFTETINPDGSVELKNLALTIQYSNTGTVSVKNQTASFSMTDTGDMEAKNPQVVIEAKLTGDYSMSNPTTSIKGTASGDITLEASQAKAVFGKGKFELSGPPGGLLENISKSLQELIDLTTALQAETHVGNLGYATAPPTNVAQYAKAMTGLTTIKTLIDLLKA